MRNNDIMDEDFGKEIDEPESPIVGESWAFSMLGTVVTACIASILIALTYRLDQWIVR